MKQIIIISAVLLLLVGLVSAISFYGDADFKGLYKIWNVTNVSATKYFYNNGTELTGGGSVGGSYLALTGGNLTGNVNMTGYNLTATCIRVGTTGLIC